MKWHSLCKVIDLPINTMQNHRINNENLLVVNADNDFFIIQQFCTHDDIQLSLGCIKQQTIKCSLHGTIFDLATGKVLAPPAETPLTTFKTQVVNGEIEVFI